MNTNEQAQLEHTTNAFKQLTESLRDFMSDCILLRAVLAQSARELQAKQSGWQLTITIRPEMFEDCCAPVAIECWGTRETVRKYSNERLGIYSLRLPHRY